MCSGRNCVNASRCSLGLVSSAQPPPPMTRSLSGQYAVIVLGDDELVEDCASTRCTPSIASAGVAPMASPHVTASTWPASAIERVVVRLRVQAYFNDLSI